MSIDDLVTAIAQSKDKYGIEGVTYSGGEPSLQKNLPILTSKIKELGLGVISFTGRTYEDVKDIFDGCDVVIDGAYKQNEQDTKRRIIGSKNQRIICLTNRYNSRIDAWFDKSDAKVVEISLSDKIVINGDAI